MGKRLPDSKFWLSRCSQKVSPVVLNFSFFYEIEKNESAQISLKLKSQIVNQPSWMQKYQICPICTKIVEVYLVTELKYLPLILRCQNLSSVCKQLPQFWCKLGKFNIFTFRRVDLLFEITISLIFEHFDFFSTYTKIKIIKTARDSFWLHLESWNFGRGSFLPIGNLC